MHPSTTSGTAALLETLTAIASVARDASRALAAASASQKNAALHDIASSLRQNAPAILEANAADTAASQLHPALIDRLRLTKERIADIAAGIEKIADLPDPTERILREWTLPNGLRIRKRAVPIGVIGIIYESRPNVTADAAALCLKAGNATILRGGAEAFHSNTAIANALEQALAKHGFNGAASLVPVTTREAVPLLCSLEKYIDLMIPRGGHTLIETVKQHARMPVIMHYNGICHTFVHRDADPDMAENIVLNAKCQRPGVCNAMETLLVDAAIAPTFVPRITAALNAYGVEIHADANSHALAPNITKPASPSDWDTEWLAPILNLRIVADTNDAIEHIAAHGSRHSDAIVTENAAVAEFFLNAVDSATVYWNASTRFTDGGAFGFGAEIGISTGKLHARGPMALEELTIYKYQIIGHGQTRGTLPPPPKT
ncbi:MAG: glutamate-5-semialdehyde dehydrogenase [Puniceicoccales bacterium]|jgi:glutamate-5-semialdehyde dehydrogenase|nr:glutamate-5-semialdehyde dehydrogenase [Puniceicoccales bacterium]